MKPIYIFIIDTDSYAGNFERQLTAFCTGEVGECGVGDIQAEQYRLCPEFADRKLFNNVISLTDPEKDNECRRPVRLMPTPGYWNDGLGNAWPDTMWGKKQPLKVFKKSKREHGTKGQLTKHPSYQSVGILFESEPTKKQMGVIMQRAKEYKPAANRSSFNILGFRLVREIVVVEHIELWSEHCG